jgi:exosortase
MKKYLTKRNILFAVFIGLVLVLFGESLNEMAGLTLHSELYSHIPLVPLISLFLLYVERKEIKTEPSYSFKIGSLLALAGLCFLIIGKQWGSLSQNDRLSVMMTGVVACILGGVILFYGVRFFRKALFPLLFLVFIIPIPTELLNPFIRFLQIGSTRAADLLLKATGTPFVRDGFMIALPDITIEVAKECSGIRSSICMVITGILAAHLFLRTGGRKILLVLSVVPITIFKNGVRILTLSLLAVYVNTSFITNSSLHRDGGILFFILGLGLLAPILWYLRKAEGRGDTTAGKVVSYSSS